MGGLEELLDQVPVLSGPRQVEELPGGLTNLNLRVRAAAGDFVVRLTRSDAALLDIDRVAEHSNSGAAAAAGVGAPVIDWRPDLGLLVVGFLEGRTLSDADLRDPDTLRRAVEAVRRLHAGPRFVNDFDMFRRQAGYLATVRDRGFRLPDGYDDHAGRWDDVRRVLTATAPPTVPCNNDLLAANFIDDGDRVWLIDYEYSGNNDPGFELGNTVTECNLDDDSAHALVQAYLGQESRAWLARVRLGALCSEYGWSLWGVIQAATSPLDVDFETWALTRYEKAARTFTSRGFLRLLDDVQRDD
jgi:thiamine kinase-like enzyme